MGVMERRKRRAFTREFKAETVRLVVVGGRSIPEVARDLDLTESALRAWVRQAEVDAGRGKPGALTTEEREEPSGHAGRTTCWTRNSGTARLAVPGSSGRQLNGDVAIP